MQTIFGIDVSRYLWIRSHGTVAENEALDIIECNWAKKLEYQEMAKSDRMLMHQNNDWIFDPQ